MGIALEPTTASTPRNHQVSPPIDELFEQYRSTFPYYPEMVGAPLPLPYGRDDLVKENTVYENANEVEKENPDDPDFKRFAVLSAAKKQLSSNLDNILHKNLINGNVNIAFENVAQSIIAMDEVHDRSFSDEVFSQYLTGNNEFAGFSILLTDDVTQSRAYRFPVLISKLTTLYDQVSITPDSESKENVLNFLNEYVQSNTVAIETTAKKQFTTKLDNLMHKKLINGNLDIALDELAESIHTIDTLYDRSFSKEELSLYLIDEAPTETDPPLAIASQYHAFMPRFTKVYDNAFYAPNTPSKQKVLDFFNDYLYLNTTIVSSPQK